ncbi:hypothetical protein LCGC14_0745710 [marine sediment metagenome]|uniref:histidine kinase n=2 Tax=root TaxID=1 RepID=A0A831VRK2_9FLAO|nr:HAMP domain-containing histidine kinase [Pricia antarctica]
MFPRVIYYVLIVSVFCLISQSGAFAQTKTLQEFLPPCDYIEELNEPLEIGGKPIRHANSNSIIYDYCRAKNSKDYQGMARALYTLADNQDIFREDVELAGKMHAYLMESLRLSRKFNFPQEEMSALEVLISNFTHYQFYNPAQHLTRQFKTLALREGDSIRIAEGLMLEGRIYREQKLWANSDSVLKRSFNYFKDTPKGRRIKTYGYLHMASLKNEQGEYAKGLQYSEEGIQLIKQDLSSDIYFLVAHLAFQKMASKTGLGNYDYADLLNQLKNNGSIGDMVWVKIKLNYYEGILYEKAGEPLKAISTYLKATEMLSNYGTSQEIMAFTKRLFPLLKEQGKLDNEAYDSYTHLIRNLEKAEKEKRMAFLFTSYYHEFQEDAAQLEMTEIRLKSSKKFIYVLSILIFFIVLAVLKLYDLYRTKLRLNEKIKKINSELKVTVAELSTNTQHLNEAKKNLEQSLEKRELLIKRLKNFSSVAAHDLKEPSITILSLSRLLGRTLPGKMTEGESELFGHINQSAKRMISMVKRLYDYSSNTLALLNKFKPVDLNKIVENVQDDLYDKIQKSKAEIDVVNLHTVIGDRMMLYQVFQNLISNSIKYGKEDTPPKIKIDSVVSEDNQLVVSVEDNGRGITENPEQSIFKNFTRGIEIKDTEGHGLGLATCKEIIDIHKGKIWYSSVPGAGTTFYIMFPEFVDKSASAVRQINIA